MQQHFPTRLKSKTEVFSASMRSFQNENCKLEMRMNFFAVRLLHHIPIPHGICSHSLCCVIRHVGQVMTISMNLDFFDMFQCQSREFQMTSKN